MKKGIKIMGIDPGKTGAIVVLNDKNTYFKTYNMPVDLEEMVDLDKVLDIIDEEQPNFIICERALPFAMGSKHAFTYGRDFQTLIIALKLSMLPYKLIEPSKWTKIMLDGIDKNMKPKVRAEVGVQRLYPKIYKTLPKGPKSGKVLDGPIDALLITGFAFKTGAWVTL